MILKKKQKNNPSLFENKKVIKKIIKVYRIEGINKFKNRVKK